MPRPHGKPLLSVIVPFYNVEAYFEDCLQSLRSQLLDDLEVVLVDDGSPDGSLAIAERFVAVDPRFRVIQEGRQGVGPARNTGIRHASGQYLAFVDSDDVVAPRAYTTMVGVLEESGSAIAAGNAFRFGDGRGVRQSWTHRHAFHQTRLCINIDEHPGLIADRMLWNKVYRRSFWDEVGLEFPPIQYEDYPVALRAYLEAPSVDIVSDHVYFWRIRSSGDSITQQVARVDNAHDRFTSAMMTLDIVDAFPERQSIREMVHNYFAHVDLVAMAESMVSVPATERPALERMVRRLGQRLDPESSKNTTRLARLLHQAVLADDLQFASHLALWRLAPDTRDLCLKLVRSRRPAMAISAARAVVPRRKRPRPLQPRKLKSHLVEAYWADDTLHLILEAKLRSDVAARVTPKVTCLGPAGPVSLPVTAATLPSGGLTLDVAIDITTVDLGDGTHQTSSKSGEPGHAHLRIDLGLGPLKWSGRARFTPDLLPGARRAPDGGWVTARGVGWYIGLQKLADPVVIERIDVDGEDFHLVPGRKSGGKTLIVRRPDPSGDLAYTIGDGPLRIPASELIANAPPPPDNVVTGRAERTVVHVVEEHDPAEDGQPVAKDHPFHLVGDGASIDVGSTSVALERGWYGVLIVRQAPRKSASLESDTADAGEPAAQDAPHEINGEVLDVEPGEGVEPGTERTL